MIKIIRRLAMASIVIAVVMCGNQTLQAQKAAELDHKVDQALAKLLADSEAARNLSKVAKGILVFPTVKKAGFMVGGQRGEGALRIGGKTKGYYKTTAASLDCRQAAKSSATRCFL
jgi:lipid-binding SYLF domain-containing protein